MSLRAADVRHAGDIAAPRDAIAIVGIGCKFPGAANSPSAFWDLLARDGDGIVPIPPERWSQRVADGVPHQAGLLDDIAGFDAEFFSITVREALSLDPQQRFILEVAWEAAEDAGIAPQDLRETRTGVFVGATGRDYAARLQERRLEVPADAYHGSGNSLNFIAGRLAYTLGLRGPALSVDTACSSSLTALHLAIRSLRYGESDFAFAGGVNLILDPEISRSAQRSNLLSPQGRCNTFDQSANGIVRGEGCGVILLMRLTDALAQGRAIRAVIRGSAINQDGASSGLMTPRLDAQVDVITDALRDAGVSAGEIDYVEAHGTGTSLGDPIELRALGAVFAAQAREQPLKIGSVKTNIGHLESAAGIAGVIKVVLALEQKCLPAHLRFKTPTPYVDWTALRLRVVGARESWTNGEAPLRAGVSSFGGSGSNAHVVLEQAPRAAALSPARSDGAKLLVLSARTGTALQALRTRWSERLARGGSTMELAGLCAKAAVGRNHFAHRWTGVAQSAEQMRGLLSSTEAGQPQIAARNVELAFLFTGQGAQYAGMGRTLYETQPAFRAAFDSLSECFIRETGIAPDELLWGASSERLRNTRYTQPAMFLIQYCLLRHWEAWGIVPDLVIGHSVGEFAAACAAGVIDAPDALSLSAARGRLMEQRCEAGGMMVVMAEPRELDVPLRAEPRLSVSAINAPRQTVIGGPHAALERLRDSLQSRGVRCHVLNVSHAFHSSMMEPMLDEFSRLCAKVSFRAPQLTLISAVTGSAVDEAMCDPNYWVRHVRQPVRFADALHSLASFEPRVLVEVGCGNTLVGLAQQNGLVAPVCMSMQAEREHDCLLEAAATLYRAGAPLRWSEMFADAPRSYVEAPSYAFDKERILIDAPEQASAPARDALQGCVLRESWIAPGHASGPPRSVLVFAGDGENLALEGVGQGAGGRRIDPRTSDMAAIEVSARSAAVCLYITPSVAPDGVQPHEFARENLRLWARALDWWERTAPGRSFATLIYIAAAPNEVDGPLAYASAAIRAAALTCAVEGRCCPISIIEAPAGGVSADAQIAAACRSPEAVRAEPCLRWIDGEFRAPRFAASPRKSVAPAELRDTVLITGGVGALGLALCERLSQLGSGPFVLMSRRAEAQVDPATASRLAALRANGARVELISVDVSDRAALDHALRRIRATHPPLRNIFHAAGIFEADSLATVASEHRLDGFSAKAGGAWLLHELTAADPIERFVLASSAAVSWGTPGHIGYASANGCLDALAHMRRARALPALSIQFGPIASEGMASGARAAAIDASGLKRLDLAVAVEALIGLDSTDTPTPIVADAEWSRFADALATRHQLRWFEPLVRADIAPAPPASVAPAELQSLRSLHAAVRLERIRELCRGVVAAVMRKDAAQQLAIDQPIQQWGVDSLMALEIRDRLSTRLGLPLPASLVFEYPTLLALGQFVHDELFGATSAAAAPATAIADIVRHDEIAIVGIGCRFPGGANDVEQFWANLLAGVDGIVDRPDSRFARSRAGEADAGFSLGLIDDVEFFDAAFFGINPREARLMDPQQRVVLQTCWHALEHANISPAGLHGTRTGVFLGVADNDYLTLLRRGAAIDDDAAYLGTGSKLNVIPGRVSYFFGFEGPSLALDTACSSSAVAIHVACQSLRQNECDHALAGGVNVILDPLGFTTARRAKMLAANGRCKTFDASADGYVRAEGCGVLVLKRLSDATRDGDSVIAVIRGSAINQDGRSSSLTAPNLQAQIKVIEAAARSCNADLDDVDYIEAHGTGTALGDPIELKALARTYGAGREAGRRVLVGGVKSQIGHTEAAAGAAGVIKLALALERGTLPPTLHYRSLNPEASTCAQVLQVVDRAAPWPDRGERRLGAVSSFGFSGTNAHLILAQPPSVDYTGESPLPVLCISGATAAGLQRACAQWSEALGGARDGSWRSLIAASQHGRWHGPERVCVMSSRPQELIAGLEAIRAGTHHPSVVRGRATEASGCYALGQDCGAEPRAVIAAALAAELRDIDATMTAAGADDAALTSLRAWPALRLEWALLERLRKLGAGIARIVSSEQSLPLAAWAAGVIDDGALASLLLARAVTLSCSTANCEITAYDGSNLTQLVATADFWREWRKGSGRANAPQDGLARRVSLRDVAESLRAPDEALPLDAALLAVAHCGGLRVVWPARHHPRARGPQYPFERQKFWCHDGPVLAATADAIPPASAAVGALSTADSGHYLLGSMLRAPQSAQIEFHKRISATAPAYVNDHRLLDTMVVPAASHLSMLLSAWRELGRPYPCCIEDVRLASPMVLQDNDARQMRITLQPRDADSYDVVLRSQRVTESGEDADWITHATGVLRALDQERPSAPVSFDEVTRTWDRAVASEEFYEHFHRHGYTLGPSFRWLGAGWTRDGSTVRRVHVAAPREELDKVELHAGLIDTSFSVRSSGQMEWVRHFDSEHMAIPVAIERLEFFGWTKPHGESWIYAQPGGLTLLEEGRLRENICLCEADRIVARVTSFETRRARRDVLRLGASEVNRDWLYRDVWAPVGSRTMNRRKTPVWIVAPSRGAHADAICEALAREGRAFSRTSDLRLAPESADFKAFSDTKSIEVWIVDESAAGVAQSEDPFAALLGLVREWPGVVRGLSGITAAVTLITRGAFAARAADPPPRDTEAALAAFAAGLMVEHEDLSPRVIDLDPVPGDPARESRTLCELLASVESGESRLALRGDAALALRLERYRPQTAAAPAESAPEDLRHIITGGLGGIGTRLAHWLLRGGARSIQLISRRIPDADAWAALQAEALRLGARLELVEADIADAAIVDRLADDTREIASIYHAAGSIDDELVMNMDEERQRRVLRGKWGGARNLEQLARRRKPRGMWFFSSWAASMPGAGQAIYAAANAALDAIALRLSAEGVNAHSVRFGPWRDAGMSARLGEVFLDKARASGVIPFGVEQILRIVERVGDDPLTVSGAAIIDWPAFMQARPQWASSPYLDVFRPAAQTVQASGSDLLARLRLALPMARQDVLMSELREIVARTLGLSDAGLVEPERRLFDLGMDSIAAMELRDVLATLLSLKLRSTLLLDHSTLAALSRYLLDQLFPRAEPVVTLPTSRRSRDVAAMTEQEAEMALLAELKH